MTKGVPVNPASPLAQVPRPSPRQPSRPGLTPNVATEPRAPIRVLLRGQNVYHAVATFPLPLVILGPAAASMWGGAWCSDDVEGIVWVHARSVNHAMSQLREHPDIVDVLLSGRDVKK
jgi:hypothetical protein